MARTEFEDIYGDIVREGDIVVTITMAYANPVLVVGPVVDITEKRIKVRNLPHAGWPYSDTFQVDDSLNRVYKANK